MAKHISHFAKGLQDHQSTNDWCEFMALDQTCSPGSHREAYMGNACNRFCLPTAYGANNDPKKCNRVAKWLKYQVLGGGGNSWGSCCCMWGPPGGPGSYGEGCIQVREGDVWCYVVGLGGCCVPSSQQYGCYSAIQNYWEPGWSCYMGGYCGNSACWYNYCCYDCTGHDRVSSGGNTVAGAAYTCAERTAATDGRPIGSNDGGIANCQHTIYKVSCACGVYGGGIPSSIAACARATGIEHGYQPAWALGAGGKDNNIPYGGHCFPSWHPRSREGKPEQKTVSNWQKNYQRERKDMLPSGASQGNHRSQSCHTGCCAAEGDCMYRLCTLGVYHVGYQITERFYGCNDWQCGNKQYSAGGMGQFGYGRGHSVTGPRWSNFPIQNGTRACGGFNWTGWYQCAWGMGNGGHCEYTPHMLGFGGMPANVCGGPCCCSGPPVRGSVIFKYRGGS